MFDRTIKYIINNWMDLLWPTGLFLGIIIAGLAGRRVLFGRLRRWAASTKTPFDDVVVDALYGPFLLWVLILAIHLATESAGLPRVFTQWSGKALLALWVVSLTMMLMNLSGRLVRTYGNTLEGGALPVGTLTELVARLLFGIVGVLALLKIFGIEITAFLTALGVGGLAVALALQDTLSNFFAGFYVSIARQIRVGDFIKLETGQDGYVADIGWRSTTLHTLSRNLIVIPNNKLAQSIVTNFSLPQRPVSASVQVGVMYDSDPNHVEQVLNEVAKGAVGQVKGLLGDPAPGASFNPGFGEFSLDFTIGFYVEEYGQQFGVQAELRKRILRRFDEEGILIPSQARTFELRRIARQEFGKKPE